MTHVALWSRRVYFFPNLGTQVRTTIKGAMSLTCFSHQLDSKKNGPVLLLKTVIRYDNFFPSSLLRMARIEMGYVFQVVLCQQKLTKKYFGQCSLLKFFDIFFMTLRDTTGTFYVWVRELIMTSAQNGPKQQYPCNVILL